MSGGSGGIFALVFRPVPDAAANELMQTKMVE
jgi:hypothetical protein